MGEKARPQCYFDVEINREPVGRIIFQLFSDVCPKTCRNFLCLCTGEKGIGKVTGKKLCYKGSTFHRVVKNFMIQGGDFSEGNGKGGESIFGGYFKDENFILKHDRAFLLSMANRGKHTNGSQFFITTKAAPHLDGVHVVFGLVISGFEVIEQIENLKTDAASRPYADVRVIDCGLLVSKPNKDEKIKQASSESEESDSSSKSSSPSLSSSSTKSSSSESEAELERNRRRKRKRKTKVKRSKRRRRDDHRGVEEEKPQSQHSAHSERNGVAEDKDLNAKRDKPVVRPEEIPPVPENRFLLRRDAPAPNPESEQNQSLANPENEKNKGSVTKSGRKIRGRGTIRYHTPPLSRSHSESDDDGESSETPPHWKEEMQRLKTYKLPTGEKWSKGDKLNDRHSSRWDEGNLSKRSSSWSHDNYQSDASRARTSHSKARKKDKKIKHKKKSKKVKQKKHNQPKKDQLAGSHREESPGRRRKSSQERVRRSLSRSSKDSSKKGWSRSDKEHRSSAHSSKGSYLNSRSRSRSYSRGSPNSRTSSKSTSRSRSRSRSRSQAKSRSRNRNVSESHTNAFSHSSSKQIKTSPSPLKKSLPSAGSKQVAGSEPGESAVKQSVKSANEPALAIVTADRVCVLSLSDSPPPSRWKPGQKPWKPSYERIQEIKARSSNIIPSQSRYGVSNTKGGSHQKSQTSSDSERSDYSGRSSSYYRKSKDRSSRSKSYSRSYSRSRSRSSSSSHAEGGLSSSYDSSSSSESNDDMVHADTSLSKKTVPKVKNKKLRNQHHNTEGELGKTLSSKSTGSRSNSISSSDSDNEITKRLLKTTKALLDNNSNCSNKNIALVDAVEDSKLDQQNSRTGTDCTETIISNIDKVLIVDKLIETVGKAVQEESVTNSQIINIKEDLMSSGKEEGEASSESGSEAMKVSKTPPSETLSVHASGSVTEKLNKTPSSESSTPENNKSKSKKRKRRSGKKSAKKSHSKKAKDKAKKKKEKKQKSQKKKQSFHWQPPLEFGEEEDEETAGGETNVQIKIGEQKDLLLNKSSSEAKNPSNETLLVGKLSTMPNKKMSLTSTVKAELTKPLLNLAKSPVIQENLAKTADIKTFTSHRSLALMKQKLEKNPSGGTKAGPTIISSDQVSLQSTTAAPVSGENIQVKEEKTQSTQPPLNNATSLGTVEAGSSESVAADNKWKPVQGPTVLQTVKPPNTPVTTPADQEKKPQGLRIEIKSKNKVRPGSLFDEVRKTARLNQRPRNQESSSEERSSSDDKSQSGGKAKFRSKSRSTSSRKSRSRSYSRSSSRSRSRSSSSRSCTRSRSRRRYSRLRSRTRSRSYGSYRSHSRTYSRSRSRSISRDRRRRRRSRSRSYSYDSRSRSRSPAHYRSRSYGRRSRSRRSSYSGSDRSYGHRRRRSGRS